MLFTTFTFGAFFIVVYALYLATRSNRKYQNAVLLASNLVFYGWWDWRFILLLLIPTVTDFFVARAIHFTQQQRKRKLYLMISLGSNLSLLGFFKYYNFFIDNLNGMATWLGSSLDNWYLDIILPVGISFYTFQTLSYTIDVYRRRLSGVQSFLDYFVFVTFFPHMVAGPIMRATNLLAQVATSRVLSPQRTLLGARQFLWGLFLKSFMADNLAHHVDRIFTQAANYDAAEVSLGSVAFAFQVYGDFCGYSFMAIGLGNILGFSLVWNFDRPYLSRNISEFWRRWHISLSSWFRDYVFAIYYQHVKNKPSLARLDIGTRHIIAFGYTLLVTELLLGFWHGANWQFGLFGLYHSAAIFVYYMTKNWWDRMPQLVQVLATFAIVSFGWMIFRSQDIHQVGSMLSALIEWNRFVSNAELSSLASTLTFFSAPIMLKELLESKFKSMAAASPDFERYARALGHTVALAAIVIFGEFGGRSFIYFQF